MRSQAIILPFTKALYKYEVTIWTFPVNMTDMFNLAYTLHAFEIIFGLLYNWHALKLTDNSELLW